MTRLLCLYVVAAWVAPIAIAGGAATGGGDSSSSGSDLLLDAEWECTHLYDGDALAPVCEPAPTLRFNDAGGFAGSDGCNHYWGTYSDLTATSVHYDGNTALSRRACHDESGALRRQQLRYAALFNGTVAYRVTRRRKPQRRLELSTGVVGTVARFLERKELPAEEPADGPADEPANVPRGTPAAGRRAALLNDVEWVATELVRGIEEGAYPLGEPVGDVSLLLTGAPDWTIAGTTGCNTFRARLSDETDEDFTVGAVALTRARCRSAELSEQETAYLSLLEGPHKYLLGGDLLELLGGEGNSTLIGRYVRREARGGVAGRAGGHVSEA